jgi:hypothetical protein
MIMIKQKLKIKLMIKQNLVKKKKNALIREMNFD